MSALNDFAHEVALSKAVSKKYCIALHCIALHCIVSYRIVSYRIVSHSFKEAVLVLGSVFYEAIVIVLGRLLYEVAVVVVRSRFSQSCRTRPELFSTNVF